MSTPKELAWRALKLAEDRFSDAAMVIADKVAFEGEQPTEAERARYETGLVTEAIARRVADASVCSAYLCGGPGMLNACCDVLSKTGLRSENVFFDKFG